MAIGYSDESAGFVVIPERCGDCGEPLYDSGCGAPGCSGRTCLDCGTGCDLDFAPDDGRCATALANESDEEYDARIDQERAAFGLSPVADLHSRRGGGS